MEAQDPSPSKIPPPQQSLAAILQKGRVSVFLCKEDSLPSVRAVQDRRRNIWKLRLCKADLEEFEQLLANSRALYWLNLHCDIDLLEHTVRALKINTSVRSLQFMKCDDSKIISNILQLIGDLVPNCSLKDLNLKELHDDICNNDSFFSFTNGLLNNTSLKELSVPKISYTQEQARALIEAIKEQKCISKVIFPKFRVSTERMKSLALFIKANLIANVEITKRINNVVADDLIPVFEALKETTSVTRLTIRLKKYWDRPLQPLISIEECTLFADALTFNSSISNININYNAFGSERISIILNGLQRNKSVTRIQFSENDLIQDISPSIGALLEHNRSLTELELKQANITAEGCKFISAGLKKNKVLSHLYLNQNKIGLEGCKYIAEALKINKTLQYVHLNCEHEESIQYIASAISSNKCLRCIEIEARLNAAGSAAFIKALEQNTSLLYLPVTWDESVAKETRLELENLLVRNRQSRADVIINTITALIQIARSDFTNVFPIEIWLRIFKHITCTSISSFKHIAEQILMHFDVRDLRSLCKMKIRRIKGKSRLV